MRIGAPKEVFPGEARVALTPESALQLQKLGHTCFVEAGAGARAGFSDAAYIAAGVSIVPDAATLSAASDVVTKVRPPTEAEVGSLRQGFLGLPDAGVKESRDRVRAAIDEGNAVPSAGTSASAAGGAAIAARRSSRATV